MLLAVSQGQVDVAGDGITYTDERAQTVDFSSLNQSYDETLLVRAEKTASALSKSSGYPGYIIATQIGTTNEITAHNLFGADNVRSFEHVPGRGAALLNKDVDAVVVDRPAAEGYIMAQGGMKTLPESLAASKAGLRLPKGSDLVEPINIAKAAMEADGTWEDIFRKWFATN